MNPTTGETACVTLGDMPEVSDTLKTMALLPGAMSLLLITGCAQGGEATETTPEVADVVEATEAPQREYDALPPDGDLAWLIPEDPPEWVAADGERSEIAVYANDGCGVTLGFMEGHARVREGVGQSPADSALLWISSPASRLGEEPTDTSATQVDPVEISTDDGGVVEFTTVETVDEEADIGSRAGVLWHGEDELYFILACGQVTIGSWSQGQERLNTFLDELMVTIP